VESRNIDRQKFGRGEGGEHFLSSKKKEGLSSAEGGGEYPSPSCLGGKRGGSPICLFCGNTNSVAVGEKKLYMRKGEEIFLSQENLVKGRRGEGTVSSVNGAILSKKLSRQKKGGKEEKVVTSAPSFPSKRSAAPRKKERKKGPLPLPDIIGKGQGGPGPDHRRGAKDHDTGEKKKGEKEK